MRAFVENAPDFRETGRGYALSFGKESCAKKPAFDDDLTRVAVPTHWHDESEIAVIVKGISAARPDNSPHTAGCSM